MGGGRKFSWKSGAIAGGNRSYSPRNSLKTVRFRVYFLSTSQKKTTLLQNISAPENFLTPPPPHHTQKYHNHS